LLNNAAMGCPLSRLQRDVAGTYRAPDDRYRALELVKPSEVRVILGQDPYHGEDQATGLAFAVKRP
jgi:uracil DNA glycosylase